MDEKIVCMVEYTQFDHCLFIPFFCTFFLFSISHSQSDIERSSCIVFLRAASSSFLLPDERPGPPYRGTASARPGAARYGQGPCTRPPQHPERVRDHTGSLPHAASWERRDNTPRSKRNKVNVEKKTKQKQIKNRGGGGCTQRPSLTPPTSTHSCPPRH